MNGIDPYAMERYWGHWCGPDFTGGHHRPWDELTPQEQQNSLKPRDDLDTCCQTHDKCYSECRAESPCSETDRAKCFKQCDRDLVKCAKNASAGGLRRRLLINYMSDTDPAPGSNAPSCPITHARE